MSSLSLLRCYDRDCDQTDLIVFGYVRLNYCYAVPVALISLIRSFYNLWRRRHLSKEEITTLLSLPYGTKMSLPLDSFMINESRIILYLCIEKWMEEDDTLYLIMNAALPSDIEYVSGYVAVNVKSDWLRGDIEWFRSERHRQRRRGGLNGKGENSANCHHRVTHVGLHEAEDLKHLEETPFIFYADITQIKYAPSAGKVDFDADPMLKMDKHQRFKCVLDGWQLEFLQPDASEDSCCTPDLEVDLNGPWTFRCEGKRSKCGWTFKLVVDLNEEWPLPLNVSIFNIAITITSTVDGICLQNQGSTLVGRRPLNEGTWAEQEITGEIETGWNWKSLSKASVMELDIAVDVVEEFDHKHRL